MKATLGRDSPLKDEDGSLFEQATGAALASPQRWGRQVRSCAARAWTARRNKWETLGWLRCVADVLGIGYNDLWRDRGLAARPGAPAAVEPPPAYACPECGARHLSAQRLAAHRFRIHQVRALARSFVTCTRCSECVKEFHTRERMVRHLRSDSKRCLAARPPR